MNDDQFTSSPSPEPEQPAQQPQQPEINSTPPPPPPGNYQQGGYQTVPPPQQRPRPKYVIPLAVGGGCLLLIVIFFMFIAAIGAIVGGIGGAEYGGRHIALIRVNGVITADRSGGGVLSSSTSGSEDIVSEIERAARDRDARAIVIRINSPGGSPAGSEEVYNAIMRARKAGKLVYTSMGDVAASGGYYIAAPCDKIYADANSITGSIGVIFSAADMSNLYSKIGYKPEVIKSGKFKDIGSPNRPITPEERALIQNIVNTTYINFVNAVAKGRKLPFDQVKKIADGRVFTGDQARALRLVDNIGGLHETVMAAAKAVGIKGRPKVIEYGRKGFLGEFLGSEQSHASGELERALGRQALDMLQQKDQTYNLR
ncbi:MAG: signal peptide peptidase SppA [Armatimonadota bacterium]|nr:signal peptide peptidase SppA [bacterium]